MVGWQLTSQPSPFTPLPSSQVSFESATPSPQSAGLQSVRQASGTVSLLASPLSHSSPVSTTPLPHSGTGGVGAPITPRTQKLSMVQPPSSSPPSLAISYFTCTEPFWMNGVRSTSWNRHSRSRCDTLLSLP